MALEFDINKGPDEYRSYIQDLRELLYKPISHQYVVQTAPSKWLDICLICGDHRITLRIDPRNLYVHGVSTMDSNFWEFSDSSLIPGSRPLLYPGILFGPDGALNDKLVSCIEWSCTPVGYFQLVKAIDSFNPKNMDGVTSMYTIIQMIPEAARMEPIAEHIVEHWMNPQPITLEMVSMQRALGFGTFSSGTLSYIDKCSSKTEYRRSILNIDYAVVEKGGDKIFGTVTVKDSWDHIFVIYERDPKKTESKRPGECISITGPSTEISGTDSFIIKVSLYDQDDGEIAEGEIKFNGLRYCTSYDKNLKGFVSGKNGGRVCVGYSVLRWAFMATIHVMINGHNESPPAHIYGTIKASYILGNSEPSTTRILFDKSVSEYVPVRPQQSISIPLTRPSFAVPINSDITIAVALWDCSLSHDHQIAWGSVQFAPIIGTQFKKITGIDGGKVQVFITCD